MRYTKGPVSLPIDRPHDHIKAYNAILFLLWPCRSHERAARSYLIVPVMEMAYMRHLHSRGPHGPSEFESRPGHYYDIGFIQF